MLMLYTSNATHTFNQNQKASVIIDKKIGLACIKKLTACRKKFHDLVCIVM